MINLIQSDTTVGPNNRAITVLMSEHQFEEMMYCINFVQRHRERSRQSYHNRKEKEINGNVARTKRNLAFPTISEQDQFQQYIHRRQEPEKEMLGGGRRPLQLVVNNPGTKTYNY
jgi:hypothetical protein